MNSAGVGFNNNHRSRYCEQIEATSENTHNDLKALWYLAHSRRDKYFPNLLFARRSFQNADKLQEVRLPIALNFPVAVANP